MKRLVLFLVTIVLLALGYFYRHPLKSLVKSVYVNKIKTPTCAFTKGVLPKMKKDAYSRHRNSGKRLPGMELIADEDVQTKLIDNGTLVKIRNSDGYRVNSMDYGSPYLHKDMHTLVTELEQDFIKEVEKSGFSKSRFVISSASRTEVQQQALRKKNPSATKGESSHSYGASLDIFQVTGKDCAQTKIILADLIISYQKQKKLYLTPESKTIHITIRTN